MKIDPRVLPLLAVFTVKYVLLHDPNNIGDLLDIVLILEIRTNYRCTDGSHKMAGLLESNDTTDFAFVCFLGFYIKRNGILTRQLFSSTFVVCTLNVIIRTSTTTRNVFGHNHTTKSH